jgi:hypothetical protein
MVRDLGHILPVSMAGLLAAGCAEIGGRAAPIQLEEVVFGIDVLAFSMTGAVLDVADGVEAAGAVPVVCSRACLLVVDVDPAEDGGRAGVLLRLTGLDASLGRPAAWFAEEVELKPIAAFDAVTATLDIELGPVVEAVPVSCEGAALLAVEVAPAELVKLL